MNAEKADQIRGQDDVPGQPTTFQPGTVESAVTVTGNVGSSLTWTVTHGGETRAAIADASFPTRCTTTPEPKIEIFVSCVDVSGATFSATFGYASSATGLVTIPAGGEKNNLNPALQPGPGSEFHPGREPSAFTITGIPTGTNLSGR